MLPLLVETVTEQLATREKHFWHESTTWKRVKVTHVCPSSRGPSHNGTILLLLNISGLTHRESYFDMVMTVIVSVIIALVAVLVLGSMFGSF